MFKNPGLKWNLGCIGLFLGGLALTVAFSTALPSVLAGAVCVVGGMFVGMIASVVWLAKSVL